MEFNSHVEYDPASYTRKIKHATTFFWDENRKPQQVYVADILGTNRGHSIAIIHKRSTKTPAEKVFLRTYIGGSNLDTDGLPVWEHVYVPVDGGWYQDQTTGFCVYLERKIKRSFKMGVGEGFHIVYWHPGLKSFQQLEDINPAFFVDFHPKTANRDFSNVRLAVLQNNTGPLTRDLHLNSNSLYFRSELIGILTKNGIRIENEDYKWYIEAAFREEKCQIAIL